MAVQPSLRKSLLFFGDFRSKITGFVKSLHCLKETGRLLRRGLQFELNGQFHRSGLLCGNIPFDGFFADVTHTADIIRRTPQGPESFGKAGKLAAHLEPGIAFEKVDQPARAIRRLYPDKQVNVVRHDFKGWVDSGEGGPSRNPALTKLGCIGALHHTFDYTVKSVNGISQCPRSTGELPLFDPQPNITRKYP